jgi:hypothetical protein
MSLLRDEAMTTFGLFITETYSVSIAKDSLVYINWFFAIATHYKAGVLSHIVSVPFSRIQNPNAPERPRTLPNTAEHPPNTAEHPRTLPNTPEHPGTLPNAYFHCYPEHSEECLIDR